MDSSVFRAFVAIGLVAVLVGLATADDVYLSEGDAPSSVFPSADRFERREVVATADLRERVARRLGDVKPTVWEKSYKIAAALRGDERLGCAIEVEEIGKHRAITFIVGIDAQAKVAGVSVMAYREAYGGEIRSRRFLDQYRGKSGVDPLLPGRDVMNITGATLSAQAAGRAVKKAIAVLEELGDGAVQGSILPFLLGEEPPSTGGGERESSVRVHEAHYVMGTLLDLTVDAPKREIGRAWIHQAVAEARSLDAELTSFDADSALSQLNRRAGSGFRRVPPDLYRVLALSRDLSAATEGAFDVTVSPLVTLWRRSVAENRWPTAVELAEARAVVGFDKVRLRAPDQVELSSPGVALELGGIGKGYAADRIAELLRRAGAESALVNFGESSMVAVGPRASEPAWPIWVRRGEALDGPLFLRDMALSTSESFGESGRVKGTRIGHIIDPRTGEPLERSAQATVLAPTGAEAEAWSKALLIEPAGAFRALGRRPSVSGLLVDGRGERADERFVALGGWRTTR
ncbi:MAG TPA: FAD:protein FMN transferase [Candidatus Binatia bacterium]|nr:FAD:protein FMN transferase [Candidatus Binatia bacterium]